MVFLDDWLDNLSSKFIKTYRVETPVKKAEILYRVENAIYQQSQATNKSLFITEPDYREVIVDGNIIIVNNIPVNKWKSVSVGSVELTVTQLKKGTIIIAEGSA